MYTCVQTTRVYLQMLLDMPLVPDPTTSIMDVFGNPVRVDE